jgi:biopolymer transport protein ExbD
MALKVNKGKADELFNFTPMIDVVFNLLLFFMVASNFADAEQKIDLNLPQASEAQPLTKEPVEISININQNGQYFTGKRELTLAELEAFLQQSAINNPTNQRVIIRADKRVQFDHVVAATNACIKAGLLDHATSVEDAR